MRQHEVSAVVETHRQQDDVPTFRGKHKVSLAWD
jgi:hypothetical protein